MYAKCSLVYRSVINSYCPKTALSLVLMQSIICCLLFILTRAGFFPVASHMRYPEVAQVSFRNFTNRAFINYFVSFPPVRSSPPFYVLYI